MTRAIQSGLEERKNSPESYPKFGRSLKRRRNACSAIWRSSKCRWERFNGGLRSIQNSPEAPPGFGRSSRRRCNARSAVWWSSRCLPERRDRGWSSVHALPDAPPRFWRSSRPLCNAPSGSSRSFQDRPFTQFCCPTWHGHLAHDPIPRAACPCHSGTQEIGTIAGIARSPAGAPATLWLTARASGWVI